MDSISRIEAQTGCSIGFYGIMPDSKLIWLKIKSDSSKMNTNFKAPKEARNLAINQINLITRTNWKKVNF
jgi:hypothetical protein